MVLFFVHNIEWPVVTKGLIIHQGFFPLSTVRNNFYFRNMLLYNNYIVNQLIHVNTDLSSVQAVGKHELGR